MLPEPHERVFFFYGFWVTVLLRYYYGQEELQTLQACTTHSFCFQASLGDQLGAQESAAASSKKITAVVRHSPGLFDGCFDSGVQGLPGCARGNGEIRQVSAVGHRQKNS